MAGISTPLRIAPVTLTGRFVRLEPLTRGHIDAMARWAYDAELWKWTAMLPLDRALLERWVEDGLAGEREGTALPFATVLVAENLVVENCTRFSILRRATDGWRSARPSWPLRISGAS